jgi:hypothetical protein
VVLDAFAGLSRSSARYLYQKIEASRQFIGTSFTIEIKVPLSLRLVWAFDPVEVEPTTPWFDFCAPPPYAAASAIFAAHIGRSLPVVRIPFTLMTVASTSTFPGSV